MAPVASRRSEVFEELWHAVIVHGAIVAAGFVAERRRLPALPDPGGPPRRHDFSRSSKSPPLATQLAFKEPGMFEAIARTTDVGMQEWCCVRGALLRGKTIELVVEDGFVILGLTSP
jgi:hypothetical protein